MARFESRGVNACTKLTADYNLTSKSQLVFLSAAAGNKT